MSMMLQQIDNRTCELCRSADPVTLHTVFHQGAVAHLCTACVLAQHPASFCPVCFDVHVDMNSSDNNTQQQRCANKVRCVRCPAAAHLTCLPSSVGGYMCPKCCDPSFAFFDCKQSAQTVNGGGMVSFTAELTKQLVCAAEIAAASMQKAAAIAKANAEKKAAEALVARRKAKKAIERMDDLIALEQRLQRRNAFDLDDGQSSN